MMDFEVRSVHVILTAIADGELTEETFHNFRQFVEKCQAKDRNAWKSWADADKQRLWTLHRRGASIAEIAKELGRSEASIRFMLTRRPGRRSA
jgi:hypothetical protein